MRRELMELHTLGVTAIHAEDVQEIAVASQAGLFKNQMSRSLSLSSGIA